MLIYIASSGANVIQIIDLADQLIIESLSFRSTRIYICTSNGPTSLVLGTRHSSSPRRPMDLSERGLECHRHLDDLLSSSEDASLSTGGS